MPPDAHPQGLMTVEAVEKALNRSRASVYRYANTDVEILNPPYDPNRLNPELRVNRDDPLLFHPNEVARFAQDVLRIKQVTIEVQQPPETVTQELLKAILAELQAIRALLADRSV
ncbi:MAG: resolvase [Elainella sp.]